ncbi:hypothetical protein L1987_76072 [Smallanthus sonchifolius]|uniref:Uncharacterized protein n=1 Tax=Smallanthus sonchifolius TaxID=185202 RepID=A0ACB9A8Y3_9ASTR|nr:hypothetical protein L1987_76072 [Smallanthus sonchifolius]
MGPGTAVDWALLEEVQEAERARAIIVSVLELKSRGENLESRSSSSLHICKSIKRANIFVLHFYKPSSSGFHPTPIFWC